MGLARTALLRASRSPTLARITPRIPGVRRAVRRFTPGEELQDALDAAAALSASGLGTTLTQLGENVATIDQAEAAAKEYADALGAVEGLGLDAEISVKLTHLGLDIDPPGTEARLARLVEESKRLGRRLWIDMEDSSYVEPTLALYRRLQDRYGNVGVCLQAYLHRTPGDIAALRPLHPGIRLVKGAYREKPAVALQHKPDIDAAFLDLAFGLAESAAEGEIRAAIATHDTGLLASLEQKSASAGFGRDTYEVQMLYGIRSDDQLRIAGEGYPMRTLITYGPAWYAWYVRRLAERPSSLWLVVRSLLSRPARPVDAGTGDGP